MRPNPLNEDSVVDFGGSIEQSWNPNSSISQDVAKKQCQLVNRLNRAKAVAASRNVSADSSQTASVVVESSIMENVCPDHQQKMSSFCLKDSLMVCLKCLLYGSHKGHDSLDLDDETSRDTFKRIQEENLKSSMKEMEEASELKRQELRGCFIRLNTDIKAELDKIESNASTELDIYLTSRLTEMKENLQQSNVNQQMLSMEIQKGIVQKLSSDSSLQIHLPKIIFKDAEMPSLEYNNFNGLNNVIEKQSPNEAEVFTISSSSSKNSLPNVRNEEDEDVGDNGTSLSVDVDGQHSNKLEPIEIVYVESPDVIHIRKKSNEESWKQLEMNIIEEVEKSSKVLTEPMKGEKVLCFTDDHWFRGVFKGSIPNGKYKIKLIDIGKTVQIAHDNLRQLDKWSRIKKAECVTETIGLANLESAAGDCWSESTIDLLRSKIGGTHADIFLKKVGGNKSVDIVLNKIEVENPFAVTTTSAESISSFLISNGHARKRGNKQKVGNLTRMSPQFCESPPSPPLLSEVSINDYDQSYVPDSLPLVPDKQIFSGILTHIDPRAVVWVVSMNNRRILQSVRNGCQNCKEIDQEIDQGCLYVGLLHRVKVRARVLKIYNGWCLCIDVDSGEEFRCKKDQLLIISPQLAQVPPLAIPIKLYGVVKTGLEINYKELLEDLPSSSLDRVTVSIMEKDIKQLPLPGYAWYNKDGLENSGNLAWLLLKKGYVRVCTTYKDWIKEFADHGLEWLLDPFESPLKLSSLPCPVPVEVGVWSMVSVEGLFYPLNRHGEEQDVNVNTKDGNLVGCKFLPFSSNQMNLKKKYNSTVSLTDSLRVTDKQLANLFQASESFEGHLNEAAKTAKMIEEVSLSQKVLAFFTGEDGSGVWSRGIVEFIPRNNSKVWIYFLDYGHRSLIDRDNIRELKESFVMEPLFCKDVWFPMPGDNGQLRTIRKEIRDSGPGMFIFVKVEKVIPKGYPETNEVQASFWKVFEDQENPGFHSIAKIC